MFKALVLHRNNGGLSASIEKVSQSDLPAHDVLIDVKYSSVNYKDALAVTGKGKIIRGEYPFVPGIDVAGEVISSKGGLYQSGDQVIGTGWSIGEAHWGGYAERAALQSQWLVPLPEGLSLQHAMTLGTAGFTAMLSVMALEDHHVTPTDGEIVVTGATGGVSSIAIYLLSQLGYSVVASTGKSDAETYLKNLGASRIIGREVLGEGPERPLDKGKWAGAIDSVGGATLAAVLSQTKRHGAVAACGLASGAEFETSVYPFILRGVNLLGIDSNTCPLDRRLEAWNRLAKEMPKDVLDDITEVISLEEVPAKCEELMAGRVKGRIVVEV